MHVASSTPATALFERVLCAVNGSAGSIEGVREAIALASPNGAIRFVAVTDVRGVGANRVASLGEHRAEEALATAHRIARGMGAASTTELVHGADVVGALLERARDHQLLVAGSHRETRLGGIMIGSVATNLVHRAQRPLLIARSSPTADAFPRRIVIAVACDERDAALVAAGGRIAAACDGVVHLVHVSRADYGSPARHTLATLATALCEITGTDPLVDVRDGSAPDEIAELASFFAASLVVVGHRGLHGLRALGSVSERVAHVAPCSVLVLP